MTSPRLRVLDGVRLLRLCRDDWYQYIDLELLNMSSADLCVLGQVFGSFWDGLSALHITKSAAINYGFAALRCRLTTLSDEADIRAITREWARVISLRQAGLELHECQTCAWHRSKA